MGAAHIKNGVNRYIVPKEKGKNEGEETEQ